MSETDIKARRGAALRAARMRAQLTAEQLVNRARQVSQGGFRLSAAAIYSYEQGKVKLGLDAARYLATALEVPLSELLIDQSTSPQILDKLLLGSSGTQNAILHSPREKELNRAPSSCGMEVTLTISPTESQGHDRGITRRWLLYCEKDSGDIVIKSDGAAPLRHLQLVGVFGDDETAFLQKPSRIDNSKAIVPHALRELISRGAKGELQESGLQFRIEEFLDVDLLRNWLQMDGMVLPSAGDSTISKSTLLLRRDREIELCDFLPPSIAEQMVMAWEEHRLDDWLSDPSNMEMASSEFERLMIHVLADITLAGRHRQAGEKVDQLVAHAGRSRKLRALAYYLQGRQRWYVDNVGGAIESFQESLALARNDRDKVLQAQCLVYLARCVIQNPNQLREDASKLISEAMRLAETTDRQDIALLARRAEVMWLRANGWVQESLATIRSIIDDLQQHGRYQEFPYLKDSLKVELGITLRRFHTEDARALAEELYDEGALLDRQDSHAGMCLYLIADLYIDRTMDSLRAAHELQQRGDAANRLRHFFEHAEQFRLEASKRCERAIELLHKTGDQLALQKAERRLRFLQGMRLERAATADCAADEHVSRQHYIAHMLLGSTLADAVNAYDCGRPVMQLEELEELLNHVFATRLVKPDTEQLPLIVIDDYLQPGTLLCLPWRIGDALILRMFSRRIDSSQVFNSGWLTIEEYGTAFVPKAMSLLEAVSYEERRELEDDLLELVHRHHSPVAPVISDQTVKYALIVGPENKTDTLFPVEWLPLPTDNKHEQYTSLLSLARNSVLYASPRCSPFRATRTVVPSDQYQIYAGDQDILLDNGSQVNILTLSRDALGSRVAKLPKSTPQGSAKGLVIIAHADADGRLYRDLEKWNFSAYEAVLLLFCSSAQYQLASGPFADSLMLKIREQLPEDAVVVGSRVPVQFIEAMSLAKEVLKDWSEWTPIAEIITDYLRRQEGQAATPYSKPWIVM